MDNLTTIVPNLLENAAKLSFSWYDYILFTTMLTLSAFIGIYFGCFGSKQSTANEYLMGNKEMKVFPIAVSLVASHISGITLLALPADVYLFGSAYAIHAFAYFFVSFVTVYVYLPVFFKLQITSTYEYLERRFDSRVRTFASFLFTIGLFLYLPIVIYIPALAFSTATGVNVHFITPLVCGVCIFYTTLGGLKAVVWTDTLQFIVTIGTVCTIFILGVNSVGGFGSVFNASSRGERLNLFDFNPDPTKRDSFWIILIGGSVTFTGQAAIHQSCVQKYLSVPTLSASKKAVFYYFAGMVVVTGMSLFIGLIMYTHYENCDPFTLGVVKKQDQLLPYFVLDVASRVPGLSGLFIAGIFCAALSTLSASLNCLSGTMYEDFIAKLFSTKKSSKTETVWLKMIVLISGVICTSLVFVIERLGGILPLAASFHGLTTGPLLAMFTLGVLFPRVSSKGCFYGSIIGLCFSFWMLFMVQYYKAEGLIHYEHKHTSIDNCTSFVNTTSIISSEYLEETSTLIESIMTTTEIPIEEKHNPFVLFRLSFYYYTTINAIVTMAAAFFISWICRNEDPPVHRDLLSPIIYRFLSNDKVVAKKGSYFSVEKASLHLVTIDNEKNVKE